MFKHAAACDLLLAARSDMMALQNAGGPSFEMPTEFGQLSQVSYKVYQHRRDRSESKNAESVQAGKAKEDDAALRDAAKQSQREVSHTLPQITSPLEMAAYLLQPRARRVKSKAVVADSDEDMEAVIIVDGTSLQASMHAPNHTVSTRHAAFNGSHRLSGYIFLTRTPCLLTTSRLLGRTLPVLREAGRRSPLDPAPVAAGLRRYA